MSTEAYLWDKINTSMKGVDRCHLSRHEDKSRPGIPDVSYGLKGINGWIELKARDKWPAKPEGIVKFRHELTVPQRRFQRRRGSAAGHVFVMLIVGRGKTAEYLLFSWEVEKELEQSTRDELYELSCYHSEGKICPSALIQSLVR